jgi:hypothetical protein
VVLEPQSPAPLVVIAAAITTWAASPIPGDAHVWLASAERHDKAM